MIGYQRFMLNLLRFAPSMLFNEATTTLLMPSVRSLGPLTMEQVHGAIPSPLPLGQSLLIVWPQLTASSQQRSSVSLCLTVLLCGKKSGPDKKKSLTALF